MHGIVCRAGRFRSLRACRVRRDPGTRHAICPRRCLTPGDVILGLASDGVHSQRLQPCAPKVVEVSGLPPWDAPAPFAGLPAWARALADPNAAYVKSLLAPRSARAVIHGLAHITGGGLPRTFATPYCPRRCGPRLILDAWDLPPSLRGCRPQGRDRRGGELKKPQRRIGMCVRGQRRPRRRRCRPFLARGRRDCNQPLRQSDRGRSASPIKAQT